MRKIVIHCKGEEGKAFVHANSSERKRLYLEKQISLTLIKWLCARCGNRGKG
jgi:hypothetical protein